MNQTKGIALSIGGALLLIGGLAFLGRPTGSGTAATVVPPGTPSTLAAAEQSFDFGSVSMAAGKVTHRFAVKNSGTEPITVTKMYTSCMCTTASFSKVGTTYGPYGMPGHGFIPTMNAVLSPGEEAEVEAVFDPAAHGPAGVGRIERVITLENSAGLPLDLGFSATVTP